MRAHTHTEIYRRFEGELRSRVFRFVPLLSTGIRIAAKRRIPLLLLYAPPVITTVIFSFIVYGKYAAQDFMETVTGIEGLTVLPAKVAVQNLEVSRIILNANVVLNVFALLAIAWYGSGLFAEDRRLGAHQLYFARPITRLDYFLGKFLTAAFFGACAVLLPGVVICLIAAWNSPDWSFLKDEGDIILDTLLYAGVWITVMSLMVLAVSSLVKRRFFALAGVFAFLFVSNAFALIVARLMNEKRVAALSLFMDLKRIGDHIFDKPSWLPVDLFDAYAFVISLSVLALAVIAVRLRKLEVVA